MPLTEGNDYYRQLTPLGWFVVWVVIFAAIFGIITGIVYLVHRSDEDYRHKCEAQNGRVVQISSGNICVEKETDRLLWV